MYMLDGVTHKCLRIFRGHGNVRTSSTSLRPGYPLHLGVQIPSLPRRHDVYRQDDADLEPARRASPSYT